MNKQTTVEETLKAIMPSSLDDVIRKNRDMASLRFSTEDDLRVLRATIPVDTHGTRPNPYAIPISTWVFVTYDVHASEEMKQRTVHLLGLNEEQGHTWCTSPVQRLDRGTGLLTTRSGTLYRLSGPQGAPEKLDLLRLCGYLHKTQAGTVLGVPHIFY